MVRIVCYIMCVIVDWYVVCYVLCILLCCFLESCENCVLNENEENVKVVKSDGFILGELKYN